MIVGVPGCNEPGCEFVHYTPDMTDSDLAQLYAQAVAAQAGGNRAAAVVLCRELLARDPRHADAAYLLGVIAIEEGRPEEALAAIAHAREIRPRDARFLHAHGEAGESPRAIDIDERLPGSPRGDAESLQPPPESR